MLGTGKKQLGGGNTYLPLSHFNLLCLAWNVPIHIPFDCSPPSARSSASSIRMATDDEEQVIPQTPHETLSDLRDLSIRCRELLHQLSADNATAAGAEVAEIMANFNIWTANMGVFREGQRSLASRLNSSPQISELVQQLLVVFEHELGRQLRLQALGPKPARPSTCT